MPRSLRILGTVDLAVLLLCLWDTKGQFPGPTQASSRGVSQSGDPRALTFRAVSHTPPLSAHWARCRPSGGPPGITNFLTSPAWASRRAGERCKGPSRKCSPGFRRTRQPALEARTTGGGARTSGTGRVSLPTPPAGGWALPSAPCDTLQTLPGACIRHGRRRCGRRSPGRIPRTGGERGAPAPPTPGACRRRPHRYPRPSSSPAGTPLTPSLPLPPSDKGRGWGDIPTRDLPWYCARAQPPPPPRGGDIFTCASAGEGREGVHGCGGAARGPDPHLMPGSWGSLPTHLSLLVPR